MLLNTAKSKYPQQILKNAPTQQINTKSQTTKGKTSNNNEPIITKRGFFSFVCSFGQFFIFYFFIKYFQISVDSRCWKGDGGLSVLWLGTFCSDWSGHLCFHIFIHELKTRPFSIYVLGFRYHLDFIEVELKKLFGCPKFCHPVVR
jgi:hypothetical protein